MYIYPEKYPDQILVRCVLAILLTFFCYEQFPRLASHIFNHSHMMLA
jgi:hypothetical protein